MSPRTRPPERERAMLDAARSVFIERGFDSATMLEIATRAKVGKGTLYGLADSKEDLFLKVVFDNTQQMLAEVGGDLMGLTEPLERLRATMLHVIERLEELQPFIWMSIELLAMARRDDRLRDRVFTNFRALYAQFFAPVTSLVDSAKESGAIGDYHSESVARLMAATVDGLVFQSMFEEQRLPREEIVRTFVTMMERGLRPEDPPVRKRGKRK